MKHAYHKRNCMHGVSFCQAHAYHKGFLSFEAAIAIIIASSLLLFLPLSPSPYSSHYQNLYHYQFLNDFFEAAAKDRSLGEDLSNWAGEKPNNLQQRLEELHQGTGFCIELAINGREISPQGCQIQGNVVSLHRTIFTGTGFLRIDAKLSTN